jgi:hypothetical protein
MMQAEKVNKPKLFRTVFELHKQLHPTGNANFEERTFLVWSKDLASICRKFLKFVLIIEEVDIDELSQSVFWNKHRIFGFCHFWSLKKCAANTKHNNIAGLATVLRSLKVHPPFLRNINEIEAAWE